MDEHALKAELKKAIAKSVEQAKAEFFKKFKFEIETIIESSISEFYDSYEPHMYKRQGGLLKAYKIYKYKDYRIKFSSDLITGSHRAPNDYIYALAFREGWHGGAKDGPGHPSPGTAYWRTPPSPRMMYLEEYDELVYANRWAFWGKQAAKTTSILDIIRARLKERDFKEDYIEIIMKIYGKKAEEIINRYNEEV